MSSDTQPSLDWRDDPGWRPVQYDPTLCDWADVPVQPTAAAELATAPFWASLYEGNKIVVTWYRPSIAPRATMVADE